MSAPKTKDEILSLLEALGKDAQDVADTLRKLGIRGKRGACPSCPIAMYLITKGVEFSHNSGVNIVSDPIATNMVLICVSVATVDEYIVYKPHQLHGVRDFIRAFDRGMYPMCERT